MTKRCKIHHRPLVRTHGGALICIPCRTPERRERYKISWTGKSDSELSAQSAYARNYYREHLADKKKAERRQKRAKVTG